MKAVQAHEREVERETAAAAAAALADTHTSGLLAAADVNCPSLLVLAFACVCIRVVLRL